ncbi:MAG: hypothetical protein K6G50_09830 [bacterium]|nr:hypothetical protein [bacterium]
MRQYTRSALFSEAELLRNMIFNDTPKRTYYSTLNGRLPVSSDQGLALLYEIANNLKLELYAVHRGFNVLEGLGVVSSGIEISLISGNKRRP